MSKESKPNGREKMKAKKYDKELGKRARVVALSRIDTVDEAGRKKLAKLRFDKKPAMLFSSVAREGLQDVLDRLWDLAHPKP